MSMQVHVVVPTPAHSSLSEPLSYASELPLPPGSLVRVPLGRREVCGVVWDTPREQGADAPAQLKPVGGVLDGLPPLSAHWRQLVGFAASATSPRLRW